MEKENKELMDFYKIALETRNFEISLFWQRSNYFLVLNTAISVGFFSITLIKYQIIIGFLGIAVSVLWFLINQGSKFWQSRWETRLKIVENLIGKDIDFFSANPQIIQNDVKKSIEYSNHSSYFGKHLDKIVLQKISVSFIMTLLSLLFILFWIILVLFSIFN